jgi:hypothetical protein
MTETAQHWFERAFAGFMAPGNYVLSRVGEIAPGVLGTPGGPHDAVLAIGLSVVAWLLVIGVFAWITGWFRILGTIVGNRIRAAGFRVYLLGIRTRRILAPLLHRTWRGGNEVVSERIEFDELDMLVLGAAANQPPGIALSAPEIAESHALRPDPVQESMERLAGYGMLEHIIGTTDGFGNYRVTPSGIVFARKTDRYSKLQRQYT